MNDILSFKLKKIPNLPGCYLWKDIHGNVIYVGKAKNLFKRTHQYFLPDRDIKTKKLVENIADVDFVVVTNENESLILENNLIKKHKPKYNVLLKEGSNYPYIVVTKELHPRIIYTRNQNKYKGKYYGPFASSNSHKYQIYDLLLKLFPLRKCHKIPNKKCIYYDMGQCLGPCINSIDTKQYEKIIGEIDNFFKGDCKQLLNTLRQKEEQFVNEYKYEDAQKALELINGINEISQNQNINFKSNELVDVIGYSVIDNILVVVIFSYENGKLLTKNQQMMEINDEINETLESYLTQYYLNNQNLPKKCYVSLPDDNLKLLSETLSINFLNPIKGKFKEILINASNNAKEFYHANYLVYKKHVAIYNEAFDELKKKLNLFNLALIHVFDISNLFDTDKIGAMIALENGNFNKKLYRKFIIKNNSSTSDVACMHEVIVRQYTRMLKEQEDLPNLIIADGGIQQVNAIRNALKEINLDLIIPVIGLAKNNKHQTDKIIINEEIKLDLDYKSSLYLYLLKIQDEVHRYAITFFRNRKQTSLLRSKLNEIKGIGNITINKLIKYYENITNIKNAPEEELAQYIGLKNAKLIKNELK